MMKKSFLFFLTVIWLTAAAQTAGAAVINFDDIVYGSEFPLIDVNYPLDRARFVTLGIDDSYAGLNWPTGSSNTGDLHSYWAVVNNNDFLFATVGAHSGNQAAFNWNGGFAMDILFPQKVDVKGAYFNVVRAEKPYNANYVQFYGYDNDGPVGQSSALSLDEDSPEPEWLWLEANLGGITRLRVIAIQPVEDYDTQVGYWAMDDLEYSISGTSVPVPPTLLLLGSGLIGLAGLRWKKFVHEGR